MSNIESLKADVQKAEKFLKVAKEADEKKYAEKKLATAKAALEAAEKSEKKEPSKKTAAVAKVKPTKVAKSQKTVEYKGKTYTEKDKEFCQILLKQFAERTAKRAAANKKHRTVSVSSRIGRDVALAIGAVIDNVPAATIKADPKKFMTKIKTLEKAGSEFINALKDFMGKDFDRADVQAELAAIKEMVDKIKSKVNAK